MDWQHFRRIRRSVSVATRCDRHAHNQICARPPRSTHSWKQQAQRSSVPVMINHNHTYHMCARGDDNRKPHIASNDTKTADTSCVRSELEGPRSHIGLQCRMGFPGRKVTAGKVSHDVTQVQMRNRWIFTTHAGQLLKEQKSKLAVTTVPLFHTIDIRHIPKQMKKIHISQLC